MPDRPNRVAGEPALPDEPRRRGFLSRLRGNARLCRQDQHAFHDALLVVDVDLPSGSVTVLPTLTAPAPTPGGVHAVLWSDGVPVGELTIPGEPSSILPRVPELAAAHARRQGMVRPHALSRCEDALPERNGAPRVRNAGSHPGPWDEGDVTVAVCTRDRPEFLRDCLAAIAGLEHPVADVLVIDNASRDGRTRETAEEFPFVRYVREPRRGLDWARNRALVESKTPVVAFTDDDVLVHPGWIAGILRAFREDPEAAAVTGLVVPAELATPAQVQFEGRSGFGRGYRRRRFSSRAGDREAGSANDVSVGAAGAGANMAFRREIALDLGGFDVALDVGTPSGGGGDLEMFFRLVAGGHVLVYEPAAVVRHRHRASMAELARQRRGDGTGNYSILLGAGRLYGGQVRREFRRRALWWLVQRYARRVVCSLLWPRLWPPRLVFADIRGVMDATVGRYYQRGVAQAIEQAALHVDEPTPEFIRGLPGSRRT